ncbi:MAG: ABC transporter ATP-binding protein [bacterium]
MIEFQHVSKTFVQNGHQLDVLKDLSFTVHQGEFVAVLGPSGCGKTTLLSIAAGLIRPTNGKILLFGQEITKPNPRMTVIFQDIALLPWKTALKNVEFALKGVMGFENRRVRRERALELIRFVGLEGFENCYPYQLSGGMKQRVGIARALAFDPDCILMDEPFGALDALLREELHVQVQNLFQHVNKTILLVSHDIHEALVLADRMILMTPRPGRVKAEFEVNLPRPRSAALYTTSEFRQLMESVRNAMKASP